MREIDAGKFTLGGSSGSDQMWFAREGRWFMPFERAPIDVARIERGAATASDHGYEFFFEKNGSPPTAATKPAVRVPMYLGEYVWWPTCQRIVDPTIQQLITDYNAGCNEHPGKVPVFEYKGAQVEVPGRQPLYRPDLRLVSWVTDDELASFESGRIDCPF